MLYKVGDSCPGTVLAQREHRSRTPRVRLQEAHCIGRGGGEAVGQQAAQQVTLSVSFHVPESQYNP